MKKSNDYLEIALASSVVHALKLPSTVSHGRPSRIVQLSPTAPTWFS